jgi:hypothetical protein
MVLVRSGAYSDDMKDPWSNLVETLAGQRRTSPESWPARRVHRLLDDTRAAPLRRTPPVLRPVPPLRSLYR